MAETPSHSAAGPTQTARFGMVREAPGCTEIRAMGVRVPGWSPGCSALQSRASSPQQSPGQVLVGQRLGKLPWLVPRCETNYIWWTSVLVSRATETCPEIPQATHRSHFNGLWRGRQEKSSGRITQCMAFHLSLNPKWYHSGVLNHL